MSVGFATIRYVKSRSFLSLILMSILKVRYLLMFISVFSHGRCFLFGGVNSIIWVG
jgi:hypothetical protein